MSSFKQTPALTLTDKIMQQIKKYLLPVVNAVEHPYNRTFEVIKKELSIALPEENLSGEKAYRWVKCDDRVPTITKYYSIRNWITGQDGATVYCDSKESIMDYCAQNKLDYPEFEWLEEFEITLPAVTVKKVEEETVPRKHYISLCKLLEEKNKEIAQLKNK